MKSVEHEPRCAATHCNLAAAHAALGRHDLAIAAAQVGARTVESHLLRFPIWRLTGRV